MTVQWGMVGTNGYARRACAPAFSEVAEAVLVGVASSDAGNAQHFADEFGAKLATDSVGQLCSDEAVEAIWVASPSALHFDHARAALEAGKHVLVEKMLTLRSDEAWSLVEMARQYNLVLATGYQARYVPAHLHMKALIAEGAIGEVVLARTFYGNHRAAGPKAWRAKRETARWGALADIGTHHLDLLRMLLGEVTQISGTAAYGLGFETDDTAVASLQFANGAVGSLSATHALARSTTSVEVHGTQGSVVAEGTSPDGQGRATLLRPDAPEEDITGERPRSFVAQLSTLSRVISGEQLAYATGHDGARNVELLEQLAP